MASSADLQAIRKLGDRAPISVIVTYPETTDLAGLPVTFWMDFKDGTPKIAGAAATATDITPAGSTLKTVWRLTYPFTAADLDTKGAYRCVFKVEFASSQMRYYPRDDALIALTVSANPAV